MTYATLMVHLEIGQTNSGLLHFVGDLAERFNSRVVGVAAAQPLIPMYGGDGYVSGVLIEHDLKRIEKAISELEAEFRSALHGRNSGLDWRSHILYGPPPDYIAREARCADLVVSCGSSAGARSGQTGDLVLQAGRPLLSVPQATHNLSIDYVLVCWKETREARRAVCDALELLKQAARVDVVEICPEDQMADSRARLDDVVSWLKLHGVAATGVSTPSNGDDEAKLASIISEQDPDLVVAGAYGHSRLREWMLGGVTRDLLVHAQRCSLLSH